MHVPRVVSHNWLPFEHPNGCSGKREETYIESTGFGEGNGWSYLSMTSICHVCVGILQNCKCIYACAYSKFVLQYTRVEEGLDNFMSLARADSAYTMVSRSWSTTELTAGLEHILLDKNELPDDIAQLEEPSEIYNPMLSYLPLELLFCVVTTVSKSQDMFIIHLYVLNIQHIYCGLQCKLILRGLPPNWTTGA